MPLEPEELGSKEIWIRWVVILRMFWIIFIPLFLSLFFMSMIVKVILWSITAWLCISGTKVWGPSIIALTAGLIPLYLYFEIQTAPPWLAYLASFGVIFALVFIKYRIQDVEKLRDELYNREAGDTR